MARTKSTSTRSRGKNPKPPPPTWDERLLRQLRPWSREIAGLILFLISILSFLGLLGLTQSMLLAPWIDFLRQLAGWGAFPLCLIFAFIGLYLVLGRVDKPFRVRASQVIGVELMLVASLPLLHMAIGAGLIGALAGRGGGLIGWALSEPLLEFMGPLLTITLHLAIFTWGVALLFRVGWSDVIGWLNSVSANLRVWSDELDEDIAEREALIAARDQVRATTGNQHPPDPEPVVQIHDNDRLIIIDDSAQEAGSKVRRRNVQLPALTILEDGAPLTLTKEEIDEKKRIIEQTLLDFGLPALVTEIRRGPAVTQFGVQPGYIEKPGPDGQPKQFKVRVGQIAALQNDLALALAVPRLRIEAPVPGRGIVGVEVPNASTSVVRLKPVLESEVFQRLKSPLAVALGRDVAGGAIASDLSSLPHLLISGTTGSGKSVCLNALIACLTLNNTPDRLRLVMIDPKKVELIRFNGMPHLLGRVEVEGDRVIGVLRWLTAEMDSRYELFAAVGAKHLLDYNRRQARRKNGKVLPYIAVFIDELADLMATYPAEVERTLCRLAQMARATGIHLVVATQRPSTDVITGLIKANFPARASFAVTSGVDSRVILDGVGAEHLLGRGDMLFLPPDANAPIRVQGCFVSDNEIEAIVNHWQATMGDADPIPLPGQEQVEPGDLTKDPPWEKLIARKAFVGDRDEMLEQAISLAQKHNTISASLIQRRLRVGYPRAARLMEALHEMGLVEDPKEGGKTRRTFVKDDEEDPLDNFLSQQ